MALHSFHLSPPRPAVWSLIVLTVKMVKLVKLFEFVKLVKLGKLIKLVDLVELVDMVRLVRLVKMIIAKIITYLLPGTLPLWMSHTACSHWGQRWGEGLKSDAWRKIIRISNKWSDSFRFQQTVQDSKKKEKWSLLEIVGRRLELFHQLIKCNPSLRALLEKSNENLCVVTLKFNYTLSWCKHCQRHNGPEGWVLLTKVTYLGHIASS